MKVISQLTRLVIVALTAMQLVGQTTTTPATGGSGGSTSGGGPIPSSASAKIPTGSAEEMQTATLEAAREVRSGTGSRSTVSGVKTYYRTAITGGGYAIQSALAKSKFDFSVVNPNDKAVIWVSVTDDSDHEIIRGQAEKKLVVGKGGGYRLEDTKINIYFTENAHISIPGLRHAYGQIVNPDGTTGDSVSLEVQGEKLIIPFALAGKVNLRLYIGDEWTEYYYDRKGDKVQSEQVTTTTGVDATIENTFIVVDGNLDKVIVDSFGGRGRNPVFELILTSERSVKLFAQTSEGHAATGYTIKSKGNSSQTWEVPQGFVVAQNLPVGHYYVWFGWNPTEFQDWERTYFPPGDENGGGEKGSQEPPAL